MKEIEAAFGATTLILFGRKLASLPDYEEWLAKHVPGRVKRKSLFSGAPIYLPAQEFYLRLGGNIATQEESLEHGKNRLSEEEAEKLTLRNSSKALSKIKTTTPETIYGRNIGHTECACVADAIYGYRTSFCYHDKYVARCFWCRTTERAFGCSKLVDCKFCINCYSSFGLTRCFEVSDSSSCMDCYFCHNCENLTECMFCFNTKSKRYAIANREIGREKYMEIKEKIQEQIAAELEATKKLKYDIYAF